MVNPRPFVTVLWYSLNIFDLRNVFDNNNVFNIDSFDIFIDYFFYIWLRKRVDNEFIIGNVANLYHFLKVRYKSILSHLTLKHDSNLIHVLYLRRVRFITSNGFTSIFLRSSFDNGRRTFLLLHNSVGLMDGGSGYLFFSSLFQVEPMIEFIPYQTATYGHFLISGGSNVQMFSKDENLLAMFLLTKQDILVLSMVLHLVQLLSL